MSDFIVKNGLQIGGGSSLKSGTIAGNATLDLTSGNFFSHTPTADTTFVFSNPPASGKAHGFALKVTGADTGSSYDLANASYDSVSFSVAAQDGNPKSISFKPDGTKMFIVGQAGNDINEYDLSSAWDVSTASYVQNFSVAAQIGQVGGAVFKPDGTKVYITDINGNDINEYTLSTAWDISTTSYTQNFSIASQSTSPWSVFFKTDGTKMYFVSTSDDVYEYNLSTAWDISTASYVQGLDISSVTGVATGLFFTPDGTKMYSVGQSQRNVTEYALSTAWDISTASYVQGFSVVSEELYPNALTFGNNGTKMYMVGSQTDTIHQYSTGSIDIATLTYPASVAWPNGVPPTAPAVAETDVLTFYTEDGGTTYNGFQAGDAMQ